EGSAGAVLGPAQGQAQGQARLLRFVSSASAPRRRGRRPRRHRRGLFLALRRAPRAADDTAPQSCLPALASSALSASAQPVRAVRAVLKVPALLQVALAYHCEPTSRTSGAPLLLETSRLF